jgi:putative oxidoreductase
MNATGTDTPDDDRAADATHGAEDPSRNSRRHTTSRDMNARLDSYSPAVVGLFRVVVGFLFAVHGAIALFAWPIGTGPTGMGPSAAVGTWPAGWSGLIELVTGLLVMLGLFTCSAAFIAWGTMAVAYFWQHQPHALWPHANHRELAVLYCFAFFLLVFTGGGAYGLDAGRRRREPSSATSHLG